MSLAERRRRGRRLGKAKPSEVHNRHTRDADTGSGSMMSTLR